MSDYTPQLGDPVIVEIHEGGYWVNSEKGMVVKITEKRVGVMVPGYGKTRYFSPDNVRLDKTGLQKKVEALMNRRQHVNSVQIKADIDEELEAIRKRLA